MHTIYVRLQNLKPGFKAQTRITHVIKRTQSFNCHHELLYRLKTFDRIERGQVFLTSAVWLALSGERRSAEREVAGSNPGPTNAQDL